LFAGAFSFIALFGLISGEKTVIIVIPENE